MRRQIASLGLGLLQRAAPAHEGSSAVPGLLLAGLGRRGFADDANLKKTALYDYHVAHGGKMVPFAGWSMPIQYKDSIMESTTWCRANASLFDVSHMCGFTLKGKDAIPFLESLVVGDLVGLKHNTGTLSVYTNEKGGIIDDTVITKVTDTELYNVVNAGCRDKDLEHIGKHLAAYKAQGKQVDMELHDDRSLLALQGPAAAEVLQALTDEDLKGLGFSGFRRMKAAGMPIWVTRTGYTGEDGFEISVPNSHAVAFAEKLMASSRVRLAGLGPRDSLRLEAGLCLYGNDLDESISPIEAGLAWCVGKRRREKFDFLGGQVVQQHLTAGVTRRRVGLISTGAPARQHTEVQSAEGQVVGEVTSGAFSPCLKKNVAMAYVAKGQDKVGTKLKLMVRGKANEAEVVKMPFVPTRYYKP